MDDDLGLQKAIYCSLQNQRMQNFLSTVTRTSPSHTATRNLHRNGKRNALLREGIVPTVPRSQQIRSTPSCVFPHFSERNDRPPWVNPLDDDASASDVPLRLRQPSDRVPGWTLMCSGGRIQRQNAMGSNILFICDEVHYTQNKKIHCSDLLALRTVAPLPQGKNVACFTAQVQSLVSQGRYAMFGMGVVPKAGEEKNGICLVLIHYDSSGGIFLSVEKWRITEQETFEHIELLEPLKTLRLIRERVTITLVISSEHFSLSVNGEVLCPVIHAPSVRLGESLPIFIATGGKISVREVAVVEGHKPPNNKLYGRGPPFTLSPQKSDTQKKGTSIIQEEDPRLSGMPSVPDGKSGRKTRVVERKKTTKETSLASVVPNIPPGIAPELFERIEAEIIEHSPNVDWDDIAGIPDAKRLLKEAVILPLLVPELFTGVVQPWKGVLLFGPPGTGKTMLARAVATSSKTTFFNISASSLISKYFGESEKIVRSLFLLARHYAPSTIFFDEVDALMSSRGGNEHEASRRIKSEMLQQFDGLCNESDRRVLVLATTNRPWDLDEAMRRRLEKRIYIPLPDKDGRLSLLRKQTSALLLDPDVNLELLANDKTEGFSGADMNLLVRDAAMMPMRRLIADRSPAEIAAMKEGGKMVVSPVTMNDFEDALKKIQPSVSKCSISQFEKWAEELGSL
uniref:Katanin p60 ATPase-containing subunit A1 n=1 Tax=Trypanosoma congolense (strain IL3000) TaxID=1068625 RepID=G0UVC7_TRYCI|nr:putative katanin [Trypanosoma congolense IL3000]